MLLNSSFDLMGSIVYQIFNSGFHVYELISQLLPIPVTVRTQAIHYQELDKNQSMIKISFKKFLFTNYIFNCFICFVFTLVTVSSFVLFCINGPRIMI